MNSRNLVILGGVAVALVAIAAVMNSGSKPTSSKLNGRKLIAELDVGQVARIEAGDRLKLAAGDKGWVIESYFGYPADHKKIVENLLKLTELKVGQTARGQKIEKPVPVKLVDAKGGELASLELGEKHSKWGHGRYAKFEGETVLVTDTLDAFDGDAKSWCETKIVDEPWISFNEVMDPAADAAKYGFATGVTAKVTIAGDTNRVITVGNAVKEGGDRYVKLDGADWVYTVSSYSVDKFLPKPPEPKKEEPKAEAAVK